MVTATPNGTYAAGNTYVPIYTNTLVSAQASVTFSSIPSTYTDLVLVANVQAATGANIAIQFNGDTASNYSSTILTGNGTAASSLRYSSKTYIITDNYGYPTTSNFNVNITHIQNYSNATTYKTTLTRANSAASGLDASVGLWRSTAAITSIVVQLVTPTANINTGSTFSLYGIKAA